MKLRTGVAIAVVGVLGFAIFTFYSDKSSHQTGEQTNLATSSIQPPAAAAATAAVATVRSAAPAKQVIYFVPITGGRPRPVAPIDPFPRVQKTRNGLPLESDPFIAESVEEQRWLDRNGFPNEQQQMAYSSAPDIVLEQAAAHGDELAAVMLASRQLSHGDHEAAGKLMTAGANGSSYALSLLAGYLAANEGGDPKLAYALSRVVELRGDWRGSLSRDFMFRRSLTPVEKLEAEGEALKMLQDFRQHSTLGNYVDPRPIPQVKR